MNVTRTFPAFTQHPRCHMTLSEAEVAQLPKNAMQQGNSLTSGHCGTVVSYTNGEVRGYVVEVKYDRGPADAFLLPCSIEPAFGIDRFDGMLIQDVEAFSLTERLNWKTARLDIFRGEDAVDTQTYLQARGFAPDASTSSADSPALNPNQVNALYAEAFAIVGPLISAAGRTPKAIGDRESDALERAIALFSRVLLASPRNASALWLSGKAQQMLGRNDRALE